MFEDNPRQRPILGHIHIPKTAGSSIRHVLDESFKSSHIHLYTGHRTTFVFENEELSAFFQRSSVQAFSSHFVRRFPPLLGNRPAQYITSLRDPVEQFISYVTYTRKLYLSIKDPELLSHLPPHMPDLSIRECARWILNAPARPFRNFSENYNTNFFARYDLLDMSGLEYGTPEYRERRLAAARRVLGRFLLVGISEHLDLSWSILQSRAAAVGIPLPDARIPVLNVTASQRDSGDWIHTDDEVGGQLLSSVAEDMQLYREFYDRFRTLAGQSRVA